MSEWQMPANLMSKATSWGPTSRRSMVVLVSGAVADVAAIAETVVVILLEPSCRHVIPASPANPAKVTGRARACAPAIANQDERLISPEQRRIQDRTPVPGRRCGPRGTGRDRHVGVGAFSVT